MPDKEFEQKQSEIVADAANTAARIVNDAAVVARSVIQSAEATASTLVEKDAERSTAALANALREVFGENTKTQRFIDVSKIPLICLNIDNMHKALAIIQEAIERMEEKNERIFVRSERFQVTEKLVFGLVGIILTAVVGAIIYSVLK